MCTSFLVTVHKDSSNLNGKVHIEKGAPTRKLYLVEKTLNIIYKRVEQGEEKKRVAL